MSTTEVTLSTRSLATLVAAGYVDIRQHTEDGRPRPTEAQLRDAWLRSEVQHRYGHIAAALRAHLLTEA